MRSIFLGLAFIVSTMCETHAIIHKSTEYFLDIELSKKKFLIDCPGGLEGDNTIVGFHLLDGDTYYFSYYRRVWPKKECLKIRKEYMDLLKNHATVRIVIDHPDEESMSKYNRKEWPAPFNKATKLISGAFIRLQGAHKCKAYFLKDCDLPKNYWGGVIPGK